MSYDEHNAAASASRIEARRRYYLQQLGVDAVVLGRRPASSAAPAPAAAAVAEPEAAVPAAMPSDARPQEVAARPTGALRAALGSEPEAGAAAAAPTPPDRRSPGPEAPPQPPSAPAARWAIELVALPGWVFLMERDDLREAARRGSPSALFEDVGRALRPTGAEVPRPQRLTFRWPPYETADAAPAARGEAAAALAAGVRGLGGAVHLCVLGPVAAARLEAIGFATPPGGLHTGPALHEVMALADGKRALWAILTAAPGAVGGSVPG